MADEPETEGEDSEVQALFDAGQALVTKGKLRAVAIALIDGEGAVGHAWHVADGLENLLCLHSALRLVEIEFAQRLITIGTQPKPSDFLSALMESLQEAAKGAAEGQEHAHEPTEETTSTVQ